MDRWLLCDKKRIPGLDAVRCLAILLVFGRHLMDRSLPPFNLPNYITAPLGFGWCGVHLFFMLSGYLIGSRVCNEITAGKFSFKQFYLSRTMRIFPAYYVFLFVYGKISLTTGTLWNILYVSNFNPRMLAMDHIWSLCCEEQFYILFPALMMISHRFGKLKVIVAWMTVATIAAKLIYLITHSEGMWAFQQLWFNADFFLIGTLLALNGVINFRGMGWLIPAIYVAGFVLAPLVVSRHPQWDSCSLAIAHGILLIWCTLVISWARLATGLFARLLASPVIRWLSVLSYSFYLYHLPILMKLREWQWPHNILGIIVVGLGWSLLAAFLSFSLIERPNLLWRARLMKS